MPITKQRPWLPKLANFHRLEGIKKQKKDSEAENKSSNLTSFVADGNIKQRISSMFSKCHK